MSVIEITGMSVARSVCTALIECYPDEPFMLMEAGIEPQPWTVRLVPDVDELRVTAFGERTAIAIIRVPYPPGPKVMMIGNRDFCQQVAEAGEHAVNVLNAAREGGV